MNTINYLTEIIPDLFERQRVPHHVKVLAVLLYFCGYHELAYTIFAAGAVFILKLTGPT